LPDTPVLFSSLALQGGQATAARTGRIWPRIQRVGIGEVLDQLDRELIGLKPVKTDPRNRRCC